MKNITKFMMISLMITVGNLSAQSFTVNKNIPGYVTGMTGEFDGGNFKPGKATISDINGNVIFTSDAAEALDQNMVTQNQNIVNKYAGVIGTYVVKGNTSCKPGKICSTAVRQDITYNLYGTLTKNS